MKNQHRLILLALIFGTLAWLIILFLPQLIGNCNSSFSACWSRWDSSLYKDIAAKGMVLHECGPKEGWAESSGKFCGNCGWGPLYPYLMRWVSINETKFNPNGVYISFMFLMATLILVFKELKEKPFSQLTAHGLLISLGFGSIYFYAVFPMSMALFFITLALVAFLKRNFILAGISAAILVWAHSSGMFIIPILGALWIYQCVINRKLSYFLFLTPALMAFLSLLGYFLFLHLATGHWDAMFLTQAKYSHLLQSPFKIFGIHAQELANNWGNIKAVIYLQNLLAFCLAVIYVLLSAIKPTEKKLVGALVAVIFYLLPFSLGMGISVYRSIGLIATVPLFFDFSSKKLWALAALEILFFLPMAYLFCKDVLI